MNYSVNNDTYNFIGKLAIGLYSQGIQISLDALKQILNDKGGTFSEESNRGIGKVVSSAYKAWEEVEGSIVHHSIAWTFQGRDGELPWKKYQD